MAEQAVQAAEASVAAARRDLDAHERRLHSAREERERRHNKVAELERRLLEVRGAEQEAAQDLREAERAHDAAERKLRSRQEQEARARAALGRLAPGGV